MDEKELIVGYESALDYWRSARVAGVSPDTERVGEVFGVGHLSLSERVLRIVNECGSGVPLDAVVESKQKRHNCKCLHDCVWNGPLAGQLTKIGHDACVCSPAATIVQLATLMDEVDLAAIAYEFCGSYGLPSTAGYEVVQNLSPLTSVAELTAYASSARALGVRGAARACTALDLVVEGSNSPRETDVAILLSLSRRKGGYSLRSFEMNTEVKVPKSYQRAIKQKVIRPDFLWASNKVAMEYDSNEHHLTPQDKERDEARRRVLESMGYRVFVMTNEVLRSSDALEAFMADLQRALKVRRIPASTAVLVAQEDLRFRVVHGLGARATS